MVLQRVVPIPDWGLEAWYLICLSGSCWELTWTLSS